MRLIPLSLAVLLALPTTLPAASQGLFAPRLYVGDGAITEFEVQQRARFMELVGGGRGEKAALDALVDDQVYLQAAKRAGVKITDDQLKAGIAEFAARANLSPEEFFTRLAGQGVSQETVRDFVRAGLLWREVVRARFSPRARVTEAEVDRALSAEAQRPGMEILLSEIILPTMPQYAAQSREIADAIKTHVNSAATFEEAASRFSASASRERGGRLEWMPLSNLPPHIAATLKELRPGQMSDEIEVPNAVAFFLMRGLREGPRPSAKGVTVDYAELLLPGGRTEAALAEAARIRARVDDCDDLYTVARDLPAGQLQRRQLPMSQVPGDVGLELARMDAHEVSTQLTRGDALVFLMLCAREPLREQEISRDDMRSRLVNQKIAGLANAYLAELKADMIIRQP